MTTEQGQKTILVFLAIMFFALVFLFSIGQVQTSYIANNNLTTEITSPTDEITGALLTVNYAHHEVHAGSHYNYRDFYMLNKNTAKSFLLITPDTTKFAHLIIGFEATTSTIAVQLFEDCIYSDIGNLEPVINRNRNYNNTNTALLYEDPIITTNGIELISGIYGAGKKSEGGQGRDEQEIILKRDTNYCVIITEQNIASTNVNILFDWYEHTNK